MSIILDALNKAEQNSSEKKPLDQSGSGSFKPQKPSGKKTNKKVLALLLVLVLVGGGLVVGKRFLASKANALKTANLKSTVASTVAKITGSKKDEQIDEEAKIEKVKAMQEQAQTYFNDGRFDESAQAYEEILSLKTDDATVYNAYGLTLRRQGRFKDAINAYSKAIVLQPNFPEALNNLAVAQMAVGQYSEAKKNLKKAIEQKSDYLDPYLHLGLCLEKSGEASAAIGYYETFLHMSEGRVERRIRLQVEGRIAHLNEELSTPE